MRDTMVILSASIYNIMVVAGVIYFIDKKDASLWWLLIIPCIAMKIIYKKDKED